MVRRRSFSIRMSGISILWSSTMVCCQQQVMIYCRTACNRLLSAQSCFSWVHLLTPTCLVRLRSLRRAFLRSLKSSKRRLILQTRSWRTCRCRQLYLSQCASSCSRLTRITMTRKSSSRLWACLILVSSKRSCETSFWTRVKTIRSLLRETI